LEDLKRMNRNLLNTALITFLAGVISTVACAAPISCDPSVSDVTQLTAGCQVNGSPLTFSSFGVYVGGGLLSATVGLSDTVGTGIVVSDVDLGFPLTLGFSNIADPTGSLLLEYEVTGGILGVDLSYSEILPLTFTFVDDTETVCSVPVGEGDCPTAAILASLSLSAGFERSASGSASFSETSPVFIQDHITFEGNTVNSLDSSHLTPIPEPSAAFLVGVALIALGAFGRRLAG
jgi:hypothetical protein